MDKIDWLGFSKSKKGIPRKDSGGKGLRLNKGRGGCPPEEQERFGKGKDINPSKELENIGKLAFFGVGTALTLNLLED